MSMKQTMRTDYRQEDNGEEIFVRGKQHHEKESKGSESSKSILKA